MLKWFLLAFALVFNASAFVNKERRDVEEVVVETPGNQSTTYEIIDADQPSSNETVIECNMNGTWYNNLGSEMIISVDASTGHITGEYRTAVERRAGAAGSGPSLVSGWASPDGSRKAASFTVLWSNGASATAWAGLCHVCDGEEFLKTTWILTSEVDTCLDHWSANRVGQDLFRRVETAPGPRRRLGTHTPVDYQQAAQEAAQEAAQGEAQEGVLSQQNQDN